MCLGFSELKVNIHRSQKKLLFVFGMMLHLQPENSKVLAFR